MQVWATGLVGAAWEARIGLAAVISRAAGVEAGMLLEGARKDSTDRTRAPTATAAPPAWDLEVEAAASVAAGAVAAGAVAADDADEGPEGGKEQVQ